MFKELLEYLWEHKLWWMLPPVIIFAVFGFMIIFSQVSPVAPFAYVLL